MSPSGCLEKKGADGGVLLASSRIFLVLFKGFTSRAPEITQLPSATLPSPTSQWCNLIMGLAISLIYFFIQAWLWRNFLPKELRRRLGCSQDLQVNSGTKFIKDVLMDIGGINSSLHHCIRSTFIHWAIFPSPNTDHLRLWLPPVQCIIFCSDAKNWMKQDS